MQREWKPGGEPPVSSSPEKIDIDIMIDEDIVDAFRTRWPSTWRERMAEILREAAVRL